MVWTKNQQAFVAVPEPMRFGRLCPTQGGDFFFQKWQVSRVHDQPGAVLAGLLSIGQPNFGMKQKRCALCFGDASVLQARGCPCDHLQFLNHGAETAGVVEQGQPQAHEQQPAQHSTRCRQDHAFPYGGPMATNAPFDQPGPCQRRQQGEREGEGGKLWQKSGREFGDIGSRFGWKSCLHGDPDHPNGQRAKTEKQEREPVDECTQAASQSGQCKGC